MGIKDIFLDMSDAADFYVDRPSSAAMYLT